MKFNEIIQEIKAEKYRPVYFLMGEEPYFIDEIEKQIEAKVLSPDEKEFNQSILYGKDISVENIIAEVKSYPMMSAYRVVIIREAQNIKDWELLEPYFAMPQETTILVICHKYKTVDKRKAFVKTIEKSKNNCGKKSNIKQYHLGILQHDAFNNKCDFLTTIRNRFH